MGFLKNLFKAPQPKQHFTPGPECILQPDFLKAVSYNRVHDVNTLTVCLGYDDNNNPVILDIEDAPHILCAGQTKSGKSVCINNMISQLLTKCFPDDGLHLYIADVKQVDYIRYQYGGLPHLKAYAKSNDEILEMLQQVQIEMNRRYELMNRYLATDVRQVPQKLPQMLIIFDEYASIEKGKAKNQINAIVENIAKIGRAAGVHLIIGIQSPTTSNGEITTPLKNNCPVRIAFSVSNKVASRTIIDDGRYNAADIQERGKAYIQLPMGGTRLFKGVYVSNDQIDSLVNYWKNEYK